MKKVIKFLPLVAAVLGLVAVMALFMPAIVLKTGDKFPGIATVVGYDKDYGGGMIVPMLGFSFMNLLTYILAVVGIVCAVLAYLKKGGSLAVWLGALSLLLAGIFFFCVRSFVSLKYEPLKAIWSLGIGAILAGISSIVGACALVAYKLMNK